MADAAPHTCVLIAADPSRTDDLHRALPHEAGPVVRTGRAEHLRQLLSSVRAHLVVAHLSCPQHLETLRHLKTDFPDIRIVVVADDPTDDLLIELLVCEIDGLVVNPAGVQPIAEAIRAVSNGGLSLDPFAVRRAVKRLARRLAQIREVTLQLTAREIEIARLVGHGLSNKEIGARLFVEEGTIKVHLHNIFDKLKISNRAELSEYARTKGLL